MKKILLTFDVEEFDLPRETGNSLSEEDEFKISKTGLLSVLNLLLEYNLKATFFTTANFAKKYPQLIKNMSKNHEIASHGYHHSDKIQSFEKIKKAKKEKEEIIEKKIFGFRAPRFNIKNISGLNEFGFKYDSSFHPTWMPGRYMNLLKKRKIHKMGKIIEIPPSVLPFFRLPIFWLAFKNFPESYIKSFTKTNFLSSGYTMLLHHPWEFTNLKDINIPRLMKTKHSEELLNLLERYIKFCKKNNYSFSTIESYLNINYYK